MFASLLLSATIAASSVPKTTAEKLALAIAASQGKQNVSVYVGTLPPNARIAAPLPKFTLLGSVVDQSTLGAVQETNVYYELPDDAALTAYRAQLTRAHWTASTFVEREQEAAAKHGGFVLSPRPPGHTSMFCGPNGQAVAMQSNPEVHSLAVSVVGGRESAAMCAAMTMMNAMAPPAPPPLPDLKAPAGVTMEDAPAAGMAEAFNETTRARLTGPESLASIGGAFAAQLTSGGWSADPPAQTPALYAQAFHVTTKGHHYRTLLLITAATAPQTYDASLDMQDLDAKGDGIFGFSVMN